VLSVPEPVSIIRLPVLVARSKSFIAAATAPGGGGVERATRLSSSSTRERARSS
jgi:hypothetical protein